MEGGCRCGFRLSHSWRQQQSWRWRHATGISPQSWLIVCTHHLRWSSTRRLANKNMPFRFFYVKAQVKQVLIKHRMNKLRYPLSKIFHFQHWQFNLLNNLGVMILYVVTVYCDVIILRVIFFFWGGGVDLQWKNFRENFLCTISQSGRELNIKMDDNISFPGRILGVG